jgi:cold shock protein
MKGQVVRMLSDKGFGFIRGEDNREYFFHRSAFANWHVEGITEGDRVQFTPTKGEKGLRAEQVELVGSIHE